MASHPTPAKGECKVCRAMVSSSMAVSGHCMSGVEKCAKTTDLQEG